MEELTKLKSELADCRRHSDNHRRSRDYHKEQSAKFRKEIEELMNSNEFWHIQNDELSEAYNEAFRHHRGWMIYGIVITSYAIAMTVLFGWCIRI